MLKQAIGSLHRAGVTFTLVLAAAAVQFDSLAYNAHALREHFPNVVLTNQDNEHLRFCDDLPKGKIVVIQFMFSKCERLCPIVTTNLVKVQKELEKQWPKRINIVSITVDPDHDTPQVLKADAEKFDVQPGWQFLTGRRADIDQIHRELGLYDPKDTQVEHMNMLTIGREPTGQWITMRVLN